MTRDFCCYFDHRYFDKGVAMYRSLLAHCPGARLWVLCLSDECHRALSELALPQLVPVRMADFEAGNAALAAAKANRSLIEYYFTCTASFMDWVMQHDPSVAMLTYLDSDLYFFSDPSPIFAAFEGYSTLIVGHRFPPALADREKYGKYNVGWVSFRRDADGMACLAWWRDRCLEWCYDQLEADRFADQKYLDRFTQMFRGVLVLDHPGVNLAPWNLAGHKLEPRDGKLMVDGAALIFFHFHQFRRLAPFVWDTNNRANGAARRAFLDDLLYRPYIRALAQAHALGDKVSVLREKQLTRQYFVAGGIRKIVRSLLGGDAVIG
jgi:hypothetical protein